MYADNIKLYAMKTFHYNKKFRPKKPQVFSRKTWYAFHLLKDLAIFADKYITNDDNIKVYKTKMFENVEKICKKVISVIKNSDNM